MKKRLLSIILLIFVQFVVCQENKDKSIYDLLKEKHNIKDKNFKVKKPKQKIDNDEDFGNSFRDGPSPLSDTKLITGDQLDQAYVKFQDDLPDDLRLEQLQNHNVSRNKDSNKTSEKVSISLLIIIFIYYVYRKISDIKKPKLLRNKDSSTTIKYSSEWRDLLLDHNVDEDFKKLIKLFFVKDNISYLKFLENQKANEICKTIGFENWEMAQSLSAKENKEIINCTKTFRENFADDILRRNPNVPEWFYIAYPDVEIWFHKRT